VNPNETVFTPATNFANLTPTTFSTDGLIYAQPLYIHGLDDSSHTIGDCPSPADVAVTEQHLHILQIESLLEIPRGGPCLCTLTG
jgi:hypothetical protein